MQIKTMTSVIAFGTLWCMSHTYIHGQHTASTPPTGPHADIRQVRAVDYDKILFEDECSLEVERTKVLPWWADRGTDGEPDLDRRPVAGTGMHHTILIWVHDAQPG